MVGLRGNKERVGISRNKGGLRYIWKNFPGHHWKKIGRLGVGKFAAARMRKKGGPSG